MKKRASWNLKVFILYAAVGGILLIPFSISIYQTIAAAFGIGWFMGMLNDILTQLRMMNGEKFDFDDVEVDDKPDELIKG